MTFNQRAHRRSLLIIGAIIIILLFIIYRLAGVLFPFAIGGVLAYMLFPIVRVLERVMPWQERRPNLESGYRHCHCHCRGIGDNCGIPGPDYSPDSEQATLFMPICRRFSRPLGPPLNN